MTTPRLSGFSDGQRRLVMAHWHLWLLLQHQKATAGDLRAPDEILTEGELIAWLRELERVMDGPARHVLAQTREGYWRARRDDGQS